MSYAEDPSVMACACPSMADGRTNHTIECQKEWSKVDTMDCSPLEQEETEFQVILKGDEARAYLRERVKKIRVNLIDEARTLFSPTVSGPHESWSTSAVVSKLEERWLQYEREANVQLRTADRLKAIAQQLMDLESAEDIPF